MKHPRNQMQLKGFDWDQTNDELKPNPESFNYEMPYSDDRDPTSASSAKHFSKYVGMPITVNAFLQMINKYRKLENGLKSVLYIDFSKASILRILSQENCEHIRLWFCLPNKDINIVSLTQQGLNANMIPLKPKVFRKAGIEIKESGTRKPQQNDPNLEERGNGGGGKGDGIKEFIYRVDDLFTNKDFKHDVVPTMPFEEFLEQLFALQAAQYIPDDERQNSDDENI